MAEKMHISIRINKYFENIENKFTINKFKKLDRELSETISSNKFCELYPENTLEEEFDALFSGMIKEKPKINTIKRFATLCENNGKEFYLTRTFKMFLQMSMLNNYYENVGINLFGYIEKYLDYTNREYLLINARTAYYLINAARIKRYKYYRKLRNILNKFQQKYEIDRYNEIVKKKISLDKEEFYDFICEVNKVKIAKGIIPLEICEYLICEMLKLDSVISIERDKWKDLRECVFCDFLSHLQIKRHKIHDYFNYSKKLDGIYGNHNFKKKTISIDKNVIRNFDSSNVKAISTTMHELIHFRQYLEIGNGNYRGCNYEIVKEDLLVNNIKNFKKKNSWHLIKEIEARKGAVLDTIEYFKVLNYDINKLRINHKSKGKIESINLLEYKEIVHDECEKTLFEKEIKNSKWNFNKKINAIIKKNPGLVLMKPILKYEYSDNGNKKNIKDIIFSLENALVNNELSLESVKWIFKHSILNNLKITKYETVVKKIVKYKYIKESYKELFLDVLMDVLKEKQINYINDKGELKMVSIEEVKDRLVYFCYTNNTEKILERLTVADEAELNQLVDFKGTPLELCALNNNFVAFKAIAEKGADIRKSKNEYGTLYNAFRYSFEIALYIFENYNEYFKEAVSKKGYFIYCETENLELFNMVNKAGGNPNLLINGRPVIYNFVETDNVVAIKFLIENGANIHQIDKRNRSLLDYAKEENAKKVVELLESMSAPKGDEILNLENTFNLEEALRCIAQIEKNINVQLPESFKKLFTEKENVEVNGQGFMRLSEIIRTIECGTYESETEEDEYVKSEIDEKIKRKIYLKERVPLIQDFSGNFVGIDYAPGPNGIKGQIISYGRDESVMRVFANSFDDFIEGLKTIPQMEYGIYIVDYLVENNIKFM